MGHSNDASSFEPPLGMSEKENKERKLAELELVQITGTFYVCDPVKSAKKKSGSAKRMVRMRAKKTAAGLKNADIPAWVVDQLNDKDGCKSVDQNTFDVARKLVALRGWRRRVVMFALRH